MTHKETKILSPAETDFFTDAQSYLSANPKLQIEQSTQGMFALLLKQGIEARKKGNYGIAASLVVSGQGQEIVVCGQNTLISEENPHGHAEMNAVKNARLIMQNPDQLTQAVKQGQAIIRPNSEATEFRKTLCTTLEPCPMCTVG